MIVLALDAGSAATRVALVRGDELLAERNEPRSEESGDLLLLAADTIARAGVVPAAIEGVLALAGPGSFTGTRVACATAMGLAAAHGARSMGVPTLEALALAAPADLGEILAVVDALRGEWFAQRFRRSGDELAPLADPVVARAEAVELAGLDGIVGDEASRFAAAAGWSGPALESLSPCIAAARAAARGRWSWDPATLAHPHYLRAPSITARR